MIDPRVRANKLVEEHHYSQIEFKTVPFTLKGFYSRKESKIPLRVYIEGDGRAYRSRYEISKDPTPDHFLLLKLALNDPYPNVLYLARPCQFVDLKNEKSCYQYFWTFGRYAPEVVSSLDQAINEFMQKNSFSRLELIGYSGGGALAVLLAKERKDVVNIRTIGGNLNHHLMEEYHETAPLEGSLDAINFVSEVENIPQIHYVGVDDNIVPYKMGQSYLAAAVKKNCIKLKLVEDADHHSGWSDRWNEFLKESPNCLAH